MLMMIHDRHPPPKTASNHPVALAWAFLCIFGTAPQPHLFVHTCVAIGYQHFRSFFGLRLTTFVMRHSYGFQVRFRQPLSAFRASGCRLRRIVAFLGFMVRYLFFAIAHAQKCPSKGHWVLRCGFGGVGGDRVSSSRGAELHFQAVVVFVCFTCNCIFGVPFLNSR